MILNEWLNLKIADIFMQATIDTKVSYNKSYNYVGKMDVEPALRLLNF